MSEIDLRHIASIERAQQLRGWIANSYAQIEYALGDIIVRALAMPEYAEVGEALPHDAPRRIKRVRKIMAVEGPLKEFQTTLEPLLIAFETHHENRNLLAHGFCEFLYTPSGDQGMRFSKWHRVEGRQDARLQKTFRLLDLQREKEKLTALSSQMVQLLYNVHEKLGLILDD